MKAHSPLSYENAVSEARSPPTTVRSGMAFFAGARDRDRRSTVSHHASVHDVGI